MNIREEKKRMRTEISILKRNISPDEKQKESNDVITKIEDDQCFKKSSVILAYWPLDDEPDIRPLINRWEKLKKILLPKILENKLILIEYKGEKNMTAEPKYGVLEPNGSPFLDYDNIDLVILPGIAFDKQGFRLGRGKGYYDRLLPCISNAQKIGTGFSFQLVSKVPCEPHDVELNKIIIALK